MKTWVVVILTLIISLPGLTQNFDLLDKQDNFQGSIGETLRIPIKIRNNSEKAQFYIIRKFQSDLSSTQKGYFCLDKNCLESGINEFSKRIEPGETLQLLTYVIEGGMLSSQNSIRFQVFPKGSPQEIEEYAVAITIREKVEKPVVFQSKEITIQDVYPNPVQDQAFIEYRIHDENVKAKIVMHNILGKQLNEMDLPTSETRIKLQTEEFTSGIYFYTLYLDNSGVLTRKLVVRK
jgi:Secretion system C-terminal sorting domain